MRNCDINVKKFTVTHKIMPNNNKIMSNSSSPLQNTLENVNPLIFHLTNYW